MILPQLLVVATLSAMNLQDLGYTGTALAYGVGLEYRTPKLLVESSVDYSPTKKTGEPSSWSSVTSLDAWHRIGPADGTNVLLGGGLAFSYLHADTYTKNSWRGRLGGGVAHKGLRAIMTWLTPVSDDNQLQGLELGLRYDYGHLRLGASAAGYQFVEPVGPTRSARVYGATLGWVFP